MNFILYCTSSSWQTKILHSWRLEFAILFYLSERETPNKIKNAPCYCFMSNWVSENSPPPISSFLNMVCSTEHTYIPPSKRRKTRRRLIMCQIFRGHEYSICTSLPTFQKKIRDRKIPSFTSIFASKIMQCCRFNNYLPNTKVVLYKTTSKFEIFI